MGLIVGFEHALCSVGILVDRGLGGSSHVSARNASCHIVVLFFGGCDDREALSYGARMAKHSGIRLTVIRFKLDSEIAVQDVEVDTDGNPPAKLVSVDKETLSEFRKNVMGDDSVAYEEKAVNNQMEAISAIHSYCRCNLFLVGRRPDGEVALALNGTSKCSELGPIGSLLTSPTFVTTASVLVVQQYQNTETSDV